MEGIIITSLITDPISRLRVKKPTTMKVGWRPQNPPFLRGPGGFQTWLKEQPGEDTIQSHCKTQPIIASQSYTGHESR